MNTQAGMKELVETFFQQNFHDITSRQTIEWGKVEKAPNGNSSIRYKYRATIWDKDVLDHEPGLHVRSERQVRLLQERRGIPEEAVMVEAGRLDLNLSAEELVNVNSRFSQDGPRSAFGHVSCVVRQGHAATRCRMPPHFMAPWPWTVKGPAKCPQTAGDLAVLEPRQSAHYSVPTGMMKSVIPPSTRRARAGGRGSSCSTHDSAIFRASP